MSTKQQTHGKGLFWILAELIIVQIILVESVLGERLVLSETVRALDEVSGVCATCGMVGNGLLPLTATSANN